MRPSPGGWATGGMPTPVSAGVVPGSSSSHGGHVRLPSQVMGGPCDVGGVPSAAAGVRPAGSVLRVGRWDGSHHQSQASLGSPSWEGTQPTWQGHHQQHPLAHVHGHGHFHQQQHPLAHVPLYHQLGQQPHPLVMQQQCEAALMQQQRELAAFDAKWMSLTAEQRGEIPNGMRDGYVFRIQMLQRSVLEYGHQMRAMMQPVGAASVLPPPQPTRAMPEDEAARLRKEGLAAENQMEKARKAAEREAVRVQRLVAQREAESRRKEKEKEEEEEEEELRRHHHTFAEAHVPRVEPVGNTERAPIDPMRAFTVAPIITPVDLADVPAGCHVDHATVAGENQSRNGNAVANREADAPGGPSNQPRADGSDSSSARSRAALFPRAASASQFATLARHMVPVWRHVAASARGSSSHGVDAPRRRGS